MNQKHKDLIRKPCRSEDASSVVEGRIAARRKVTWQGKHFLVQLGTTVTFIAYWRPTIRHRMFFSLPLQAGTLGQKPKVSFSNFGGEGRQSPFFQSTVDAQTVAKKVANPKASNSAKVTVFVFVPLGSRCHQGQHTVDSFQSAIQQL